jgi:hypothetical protein
MTALTLSIYIVVRVSKNDSASDKKNTLNCMTDFIPDTLFIMRADFRDHAQIFLAVKYSLINS